MDKLFLQIINMSITSSYVIVFVLILRFSLKKAPKIFSYSLWSLVFARLVFPFSFESIFSLIRINSKTIPEEIIYAGSPQINSGIIPVDRLVNNSLPMARPDASVNPIQIWIGVGEIIWLVGIGALVIYTIYTSLKLSKRLKSARLLYDNVYEGNNIETPFVFGIVNPKIYLPEDLSEAERPYIIKHEETHIKRYDHIVKFLGFIVLAIHWFNPLVWLSFFLMGRDMELSCDESVIKEMGSEIKKDYSSSLLSLSTHRRIIGGSPLAFGENNTKGRIENILNYKKPRFWVSLLAIVVLIVAGLGLLSNPKGLNTSARPDDTIIEEKAKVFIDEVIAMHEDDWRDYKIIDSKITKLEKLVGFDNILQSPIEVWNLEFRLKPDNITKASYKTTLYEEDGWITEDNGMGKRCLVFIMDGDDTRILGGFQHEEFDFDNLAKQEARVRVMLAHIGLLPNGGYEGNHVVIKFPVSTDGNIELFLSQPVIQGDKGIWIVERWKDPQGYIHHEFPNTNISIDERYKSLQNRFDIGEDLSLGDPIEVAMSFINFDLRQFYLRKIPVKVADLEIVDPATMEDFDDPLAKLDNDGDDKVESVLVKGSFLELTNEEKRIYEDYIIDFNDHKLKGCNPINIMKIYLHASKEENYEAQWELYTKNQGDMGWNKEYHMQIPGNEKMGDYTMFANPTNIEIHYKNENKYATITWEDKDLKESENPESFFGFNLESDEEGIWKVSFMPIQ